MMFGTGVILIASVIIAAVSFAALAGEAVLRYVTRHQDTTKSERRLFRRFYWAKIRNVFTPERPTSL